MAAKSNFELGKEVKELKEIVQETQANEDLKKALDAIGMLTSELAKMKQQMDGQMQVAAPTNGIVPTSEEAKKSDAWLREKIPVRFFRDGEQYKDDITTIYRGEVFNIRRGVMVQIPRGLAMALEDAEKQKQKAVSAEEAFADQYTKAMSRLTQEENVMNGYTTKRTTVGTSMVTIEFSPKAERVELVNMGSSPVYFKADDDIASVADMSANYLTQDVPIFTLDRPGRISKITLIASSDVDIQWDVIERV